MHVGRLTNPAKTLSAALACAIAVFALVAVWQPGGVRVAEAATVTSASGGTAIPTATSGGTYTTLGNITIAEVVDGDFPISMVNLTVILTAPTGFEFNPAAVLTAGATPGDVTAVSAVSAATTITITITTDAALNTLLDSIQVGGIQVRPTVAAAGLQTGQIYRATGNLGTAVIPGITPTAALDGTGGTNFGTLTEVAGVPTTTSINPTSGPIVGGTAFTLTGTGFIAGSTVTFSGQAATNVVVVNSTTITGATPAATNPHVSPVIVTNTNGQSAPNSLFTYTGTAPGAPQNVTATAGDKQITVGWTAPASNGSSAITGYTVTCNPGGHTVTAGGSATSATVTGLTNGTAYTCTVVATNAVGNSAASGSASGTPKAAATAPGAPTNVDATAGPGEIEVTWDAPSSTGGATITGYIVTCNPGGHTEEVDGSERSVVVTGLEPGTKYTCTVEAENSAGDGPGTTSNSVTPTGGGGTPPPGSQSVTVNGGAWISGQNGVVLEGGGQASGMALIIQQVSGRVVLAIWVLTGGLYQFFLPATPGVSTLLSLPGLLVAAIAVLA